MQRRELLKTIAALTGAAFIGGDLFLAGCKSGATKASFSATDIALLNEIAETIIPATDTPGAKAAKVGEFMKTIVTDCYNEKQQLAFGAGLAGFDAGCSGV